MSAHALSVNTVVSSEVSSPPDSAAGGPLPAADSILPISPKMHQNAPDCITATPRPPASQIQNPQSKIPNRILSDRQLTAITLLVSGKTDATVAAILNLDRSTVYRWKHHHPAFKASLNQKRTEIAAVASDRLRVLLLQALDYIQRQLHSKYEQDRDNAAWALLCFAGRSHLHAPQGPTDEAQILKQLQDLGLPVDEST
jgi:hypothetical protein